MPLETARPRSDDDLPDDMGQIHKVWCDDCGETLAWYPERDDLMTVSARHGAASPDCLIDQSATALS